MLKSADRVGLGRVGAADLASLSLCLLVYPLPCSCAKSADLTPLLVSVFWCIHCLALVLKSAALASQYSLLVCPLPRSCSGSSLPFTLSTVSWSIQCLSLVLKSAATVPFTLSTVSWSIHCFAFVLKSAYLASLSPSVSCRYRSCTLSLLVYPCLALSLVLPR